MDNQSQAAQLISEAPSKGVSELLLTYVKSMEKQRGEICCMNGHSKGGIVVNPTKGTFLSYEYIEHLTDNDKADHGDADSIISIEGGKAGWTDGEFWYKTETSGIEIRHAWATNPKPEDVKFLFAYVSTLLSLDEVVVDLDALLDRLTTIPEATVQNPVSTPLPPSGAKESCR